jgi:hypothetical protein
MLASDRKDSSEMVGLSANADELELGSRGCGPFVGVGFSLLELSGEMGLEVSCSFL